MKRFVISAIVSGLLLAASVSSMRAEVKMVQMKIAGYLCGN